VLNGASADVAGDFVLYWMVAYRRLGWNFALQRAAEWARELQKPLLVLEGLRADYPWASDRLHRFIIDGMRDNSRRAARSNVRYYPYIEPSAGSGKGLLEALARRASIVVTDDFPAFFVPRMVEAAARGVAVRMEAVDANGLVPARQTAKVFTTAHAFRRHLHHELPHHLGDFPEERPLRRLPRASRAVVPGDVLERWPAARLHERSTDRSFLARLPIDHTVTPVPARGGSAAATRVLRRFLDRGLDAYATLRNHPEEAVTSGLSPYLHFGHISVHQVFAELAERVNWSPLDIAPLAAGHRQGWWGAGEGAESFFDECVTWREVGFNMCAHHDGYDKFSSLPAWARATLAEHAGDRRPHLYLLEQFESAETHDELWNAAQRQLVREGIVHNYLRMLWGKKVLEWTRSPRQALRFMIELNNKYAVDGRDPNSYSGIFWVLGRYDRPWGPERPVFGKVRYMSSENTARKFRVNEYIRRYTR
jgi:deoxyribodipyrimidine photo-lyase